MEIRGGIEMQYYIDLTTDQFETLKNHESETVRIPEDQAVKLTGREKPPFFTEEDTLKVYHPSRDPEALRFAVTGPSTDSGDGIVEIPVEMLEWMAIL